MSKLISLLHISDLHLGRSDGIPSFTTDELTDTFLTKLYDQVKSLNLESVDLICATGDFIDGGVSSRFVDADRHLSKIGEKFNVPKERIVCCCGNHDYIRDHQEVGDNRYARYHFREFARNFGKSSQYFEEFCTFHDFEDLETSVVELDTTWGSVPTP